jgi:hypothetical protein
MSTVYLDPTYALLAEDWANIDGNVHSISDNLKFGIPSKITYY